MKERIQEIFEDSIKVKQATLKSNIDHIVSAVDIIVSAINNENKIFFCGNGGSAADSQHIAAEFIGRFQKERRSLPALALTTDTSILTALGNDYGYDIVFSRQLQGLARKGDVVFGISTSGNSKNIIEAFKTAKEMGVTVIALTGLGGGVMKQFSDICLEAQSNKTARIQESHICIAHTICELVENQYE